MTKITEAQKLAATEKWYSMNPTERIEIMRKVTSEKPVKSMTVIFRRCISYLAEAK